MTDNERANTILDLELQRVDRTNGMHTHHCWHQTHALIQDPPDQVFQSCCECPETRTIHRDHTGTWTPAQEPLR